MNKIIITLMIFASSAVSAQSFLVSPEEAHESNNALIQISPRSTPAIGAPLIQVIIPKLSSVVVSPTPIELKFQSVAPSNVKPESFKALYGTFQIDITKKLLSVTKVTETGLNLQEAALPKGRHKIFISIEDSLGRTGSQVIEFEVN